jgi:hypothetical protein
MPKTLEVPTQEYLLKIFYYDDCLRWKVNKRKGPLNVRVGDEVIGCYRSNGYKVIRIDGRLYNLSRIVYQVVYGNLTTDLVIDHINRNPADNRIENLRAVTQKHNTRNRQKQRNNSTGVNGVSLQTNVNVDIIGKQVERQYYVACWIDSEGKLKRKWFSINAHGKEDAFKLACEYRYSVVTHLKGLGEWYDDNHGI